MSAPLATLAAAALTLGSYALSLRLRRRWISIVTTPILTTVALIALAVAATRMPHATYDRVIPLTNAGLGPACAALGVMMYKQRALLHRHARAIAGAILAGTSVTIVTAVGLAAAFGESPMLVRAIALKSITAPVALQAARLHGIDPSLTVAAVVCAGALGATVGPPLLTLLRVRDPLSRGLALGAISHGIGTAQAATESEIAAAGSSLAMCAVAIVLALVAGPLFLLVTRSG